MQSFRFFRSIVLSFGLACLPRLHPGLAAEPFATEPSSFSSAPLAQQVQQVAAYLTGTMETSAPSSAHPGSRVTVRMSTCAIQRTDQLDQVWLYQEQALSTELNQPYRQRFLQITASPYSQTVRSLSYKPIHPQAWVNFCDRSASDRRITPSALSTPLCSVFLKPARDSTGQNIYWGNTPADGCPANVRGATRITNHILLHSTGMETWDRGFDAQGKQVWGAKAESYHYRKIEF